jgi:hypothetical protein
LGKSSLLITLLFLALASLACAIQAPSLNREATPSPPSSGDILTFQVPVSVLTLAPGESIPYTQLSYQGREGNLYQVLIDNQAADKRVGDSIRWQGIIAPGVSAFYNLRIAPSFPQENLLAGGSVEIGVFNPVPAEIEGDISVGEDNIHFGNVFVDFRVPTGENIPGTTIVFEGKRDEEAELSGVVGYPYRAVGDSISWRGQVRENVSVSYSLRIVSINEDEMRMMGSAELWIDPIL